MPYSVNAGVGHSKTPSRVRSAHSVCPVLVMKPLPSAQLRLLGLSCHGLRPCTWGRQRPTGQAEWEMLTARRISSPHSHCPACTDLVSWMLCLLLRRGSLAPGRRSSGELRLRWMWAGMLPSKGLAAPLSPPARNAAVTCRRHGTQPSHTCGLGAPSVAQALLQVPFRAAAQIVGWIDAVHAELACSSKHTSMETWSQEKGSTTEETLADAPVVHG